MPCDIHLRAIAQEKPKTSHQSSKCIWNCKTHIITTSKSSGLCVQRDFAPWHGSCIYVYIVLQTHGEFIFISLNYIILSLNILNIGSKLFKLRWFKYKEVFYMANCVVETNSLALSIEQSFRSGKPNILTRCPDDTWGGRHWRRGKFGMA